MEIKEPTPRQLAALFCAFAVCLALAALIYYPPLCPPAEQVLPAVQEISFSDRLDLNNATVRELQVLPGIGEKKAKAIIEYRERHGGFTSTEQLLEVDGIGESTYAGLKDYVFV